jgi:hypothetical protein
VKRWRRGSVDPAARDHSAVRHQQPPPDRRPVRRRRGVLHGYLFDKGRYRTIDPPDGSNSIAADINDRGEIVMPAPMSFFKGRIPGAPG